MPLRPGHVAALAAAVLLTLGAVPAGATPSPIRVLVVKATWGPQPYADAAVDTFMQEVDGFFATASFGKVAMSYTQTPWLDVMPAALPCANEAQQLPGLAASAGWDPAAYDRVVYLVPSGLPSGCIVSSEISSAAALVNADSLPIGTVVHELGQTFGMGHAGLLSCRYEQQKRLCYGDQYGDTVDPMGAGGLNNNLAHLGDFGALQKARAGWLAPTYISKPGIYRLAPLETASTLPQALVIRGAAGQYWVDVRAPAGNDARLGGRSLTGFAVHRIAEAAFPPGTSPLPPDYLVPSARSTSYYTAPGKTFTLPGRFTLTAVARTAGVMTIRVRLLGASR